MDSLQQITYSQYLRAKGYSTKTASGMVTSASKFLEWITEQGIEIATLSYNDMTAYIKANQIRSIKARTVQIIATHLKHYLNYLVEAGAMPHNPALALKLKNTKHKTVYNILSPEELETIYKNYSIEKPQAAKDNRQGTTDNKQPAKVPPQTLNKLARKRNKILLGVLIYQGITAEDAGNIQLKHLTLREGQITIPGTRRSNERTLKLEPHQIFDLYDYVNEVRKQILQLAKKQSDQLFISTGTGSKLQNTLQKLMAELKQQDKYLESLDQIRASVISYWLKQYNKRKVQYMAGHKYVSSTEAYEANNIETLQEDIQRFYPTF